MDEILHHLKWGYFGFRGLRWAGLFLIFSKGSLGGLRVYLGLYTDYYKDYKDSNLFKGASGFRAKGFGLFWGLGIRIFTDSGRKGLGF